MKFYCDSCQTKYSIADEKVRGKVLKVRCKKCSHIITVREAKTPQSSAPVQHSQPREKNSPPPPPPTAPTKIQWHYAINGESFGPFDEEILQQRFATNELGDAVYVWNETFTEWKRVTEVATFASALQKAARERKPAHTHGVSQALEAIDVDQVDADKKAREQARAANLEPVSEPEPEPELDVDSTRIDQRIPDNLGKASQREAKAGSDDQDRKNRLQALRDRLKLDDSSTKEPQSGGKSSLPEPRGESSLPQQQGKEKQEARDFAFAETLPDTGEGADEELPVAEVHDGLFSGQFGDSPASAASQPEPEAGEEEEKKDAVPFFPDAPKLGDSKSSTSMSRADEVTGSLLIQINAIKNDGRKRAIATAVAAVFGISAVVAVIYFGWTHMDSEEVVDDEPRIGLGNIGQAPEFREYTEEERRRALDQVVIEEGLVISREDGKAAYARDESESKGGRAGGEQASGGSAMPQIDPSAFRRVEGELEGSRASDDREAGTTSRFQRPGLVGSGGSPGSDPSPTRGGMATGGDGDFDDDRLRAMAALQTDTQRGIYNPRDEEIDEIRAPRERLSNADLSQGMQNIMSSVGSCRERHIFRGGALEYDTVEVTIEIIPAGRVENLRLSPSSLDDTDFGRCMHSHTRRWRFPPFTGDAMEIRTPFILQD